MKSFFYSRVSKFNALMTLCLLGVSTLSLPVMASPQESCVMTSTSEIVCGEPVSSNGERVSFTGGTADATLTREIRAGDSIDFIINARKGQTMGFTVGYDFKDSDIQAFLTEPGKQEISLYSGPKAPNEFVIKKTGDHRLRVTNTTRKEITMTLYLNID
jgi:hypothetical protein